MTWKDKLEIGLKKDAAYRKDNLPAEQVRGPQKPAGPGRSPVVLAARGKKNDPPTQPTVRPARARKPKPAAPAKRGTRR